MILRQLRSIFGDLDLRLSQPYDDEIEPPWGYLAGGVLTPEQRHVLEAAYHQGYFDREDRRAGAEIAETIGIAQSTFSTRLRDAEGRLLGAIFGSTSAEPEQSERQQ
jgi:predicted DNA binding protein